MVTPAVFAGLVGRRHDTSTEVHREETFSRHLDKQDMEYTTRTKQRVPLSVVAYRRLTGGMELTAGNVTLMVQASMDGSGELRRRPGL